MIIKIDRASIKLNPRAGATSTMMQGPREATFMFPDGGKIPAHLLDKVEIIAWRDAAEPKDGIHMRGIIVNPDDADLFRVCKGIFISVDGGLQRVDHYPEPLYLFEYDYPIVTCSNCGVPIPANEIGNDVMYDGDDEVFIDQACPNCNAYDSFGEIEYESIEDAAKEVKL